MRKLLLFSAWLIVATISKGQTTFPENGTQTNYHETVVLQVGTLHISPTESVENGYLVLHKGKVVDAGSKVSIPQNSVVLDYSQSTIYPGFVEIWSDAGQPETPHKPWQPRPQLNSSSSEASYWNEAIKPEQKGIERFELKDQEIQKLHQKGITSVLSHKQNGIIRGSGVLSHVQASLHHSILRTENSLFFSYSKGNSRQTYPSSLMGSIALLKQVFADAAWYANPANRDHTNISLSELLRLQKQPWIMDGGDAQTLLRTAKLGKTLGRTPFVYGGGDAYKWIPEIKREKLQLILPLHFPKAYDITDVESARVLAYTDLKHWEMAPFNPYLLRQADVPFVITSSGLDSKTFWGNLRKAVKNGFNSKDALASLTVLPAQWIGAEKQLGQLKAGYFANFIVANGDLFTDGEINEIWVNGEVSILKAKENTLSDSRNYQLTLDTNTWEAHLGDKGLEITVIQGSDTSKVKGTLEWDGGEWSTKVEDLFGQGGITLFQSKKQPSSFDLFVRLPNGQLQSGKLELSEQLEDNEAEKETPSEVSPPSFNLPFAAPSAPEQVHVLFKGATLWTNESAGKKENWDLRIRNGIIAEIGPNLAARGAQIVQAKGMHLTPGIVDEHSHIAISRGVNEGGQAVTAEVSIGDVVNAEDVNVFRQLAGGVTAAQLLHGSANPIGGQSAIIKLRYGQPGEAMKIKGADGFIKFALGENVKQSNWGSFNTIRFPQTRMGVEQVYIDAFTAARAYEQEWAKYKALPVWERKLKPAPRKDYEMDVLLEILNRKRFVSCHSYIQSEINMLMKVAEQFDFRINTFTHILEGYKVADKMKAHGVAGSTFSDWWAYKFEVNDAIPYNGAILHQQGVLTGFNSDDAEMGRRLNQEAAKAVKYGGVSEEEALKFVTLNPAKMLHLDDRMGSLKVGKDADIVLWTANPLSVYAKAKQTYVDGRLMFDLSQFGTLKSELEKEKNDIIQKMLGAKSKGEPTQPIQIKEDKHYHCDTLED